MQTLLFTCCVASFPFFRNSFIRNQSKRADVSRTCPFLFIFCRPIRHLSNNMWRDRHPGLPKVRGKPPTMPTGGWSRKKKRSKVNIAIPPQPSPPPQVREEGEELGFQEEEEEEVMVGEIQVFPILYRVAPSPPPGTPASDAIRSEEAFAIPSSDMIPDERARAVVVPSSEAASIRTEKVTFNFSPQVIPAVEEEEEEGILIPSLPPTPVPCEDEFPLPDEDIAAELPYLIRPPDEVLEYSFNQTQSKEGLDCNGNPFYYQIEFPDSEDEVEKDEGRRAVEIGEGGEDVREDEEGLAQGQEGEVEEEVEARKHTRSKGKRRTVLVQSTAPISFPFRNHKEKTNYPGAVLLNHRVFRPREAEVKVRHGQAYFQFQPEDKAVLKKQIKLLQQAIQITMDHQFEFEKDQAVVIQELRRLDQEISEKRRGIAELKKMTADMSQSVILEEKKNEEMKAKVNTRLPRLQALEREKEKLEKAIAVMKANTRKLEEETKVECCRGCGEDPETFLAKLNAARELHEERRGLLAELQMEEYLKKKLLMDINSQIQECVFRFQDILQLIQMGGVKVDEGGEELDGEAE